MHSQRRKERKESIQKEMRRMRVIMLLILQENFVKVLGSC